MSYIYDPDIYYSIMYGSAKYRLYYLQAGRALTQNKQHLPFAFSLLLPFTLRARSVFKKKKFKESERTKGVEI